MPLAIYRKASSTQLAKAGNGRFQLIPVMLIILGSFALGSVAGPIIGYFAIIAPRLQPTASLLSPLPSSTVMFGPQALAAPASQPASSMLGGRGEPVVYENLDYTKPENWFPDAPYQRVPESKITHYNLAIPTLGIYDAVIEIGGDNLGKSLIQYPGTANPGELGAPVIFGHSILRQFYNPKNYLSIFSTIMTLKTGDAIEVNYDGVQYRYRVIDKIEVKPTDIQILEQRYNGRYLKLVTCVPEGTYLRRGVVIAELEQS